MAAAETEKKTTTAPKVAPEGVAPIDAKGNFETDNTGAAQHAAERAMFPDEHATEFEFGGVKFKVKQLTLKRERTFLRLFPVLQEPFDKFNRILREEEDTLSRARAERAPELERLQSRLDSVDTDILLAGDDGEKLHELGQRRLEIQQQILQVNAAITGSRTGLWTFLIEVITGSGDDLINALVSICSASLDNAKPAGMNQAIDADWVEDNLKIAEIATVIGAQIQQQSWGNFFQRAVGQTAGLTTSAQK